MFSCKSLFLSFIARTNTCRTRNGQRGLFLFSHKSSRSSFPRQLKTSFRIKRGEKGPGIRKTYINKLEFRIVSYSDRKQLNRILDMEIHRRTVFIKQQSFKTISQNLAFLISNQYVSWSGNQLLKQVVIFLPPPFSSFFWKDLLLNHCLALHFHL